MTQGFIVPASSRDQLWMASAAQLGELLARNEVSPLEILDSVLGRIEAVDGQINAFCHIARDSARQAAKESEARSRRGCRIGALDGVPIHVKDNIFVKSMPCTWGSRLYENFVPDVDDVPVAKLRATGAVLIGKTNTPEFALMGRTENDVFGATRNPHRLSHTPGGSSGGAAAAVAAGMGPLGLATDSGGSIRRPASYCGVVGLKTSLGMVRRGTGFPATVHDFQTIGPIARDIDDAALLFQHIAEPGSSGPLSAAPRHIGIVGLGEDEVLESAVAERLASVRAQLGTGGHRVSEIAAPWSLPLIEDLWLFFSAVGAARIASRFDADVWNAQATAQVKELAEKGRDYRAWQYVEKLDCVHAMREESKSWFKEFDLIVTPTSAFTAWPLGQAYPPSVNGRPAGARAGSAYMAVANVAGLPGLSIPAGFDTQGLPVGVQLLGPPGQDGMLLAMARECGLFFRRG